LQELRLDGRPLSANLLGVLLGQHIETAPTDAYVRGEDLVVTYAQSIGRALRVQVYWRCVSNPSALVLELQVSVQTDELGIATPIVAYSQMAVVEVRRLIDSAGASFATLSLKPGSVEQLVPQDGPGCLLFDPPAIAWSYAEMIHPADFQADQIGMHAPVEGRLRATLEHRLFPGSLEKGVILRARLRGMFVPQSGAEHAAAVDYLQFLRAPLPLTT
jgi:hypothetical protein